MRISEQTVRNLLADQFPEWADLPVRQVRSAGTVNAIFRIGEGLTARFPLAGEDDDIQEIRRELQSEMYAGRLLFSRTSFATPEPVALGEPGFGYPLPWSVQTWLPGTIATDEDPGGSWEFAGDLAELISGMRAVGTGGRTFAGRGRGGVIESHADWVRTCLRKSGKLLPVPQLGQIWNRMRELPRGSDGDVMTHGDLMPGNVLVAEGRLTGVLDVGGFRPADPALDLTSAWHLLEHGPRQRLRADLGCDDLTWARGQAWAFEQSLGLVWFYETSNPVMSRIGQRTLSRILDDPQ
ncbi:aminoglycoside phosphotransferase family protein [Actinoplanes sp. GCM10030250]|uniref:aminoglycoside phosphotransferase family protein n=1 Tax=Actinoplanes sp. GCM10030250 TaxID=3273376 RepID=UPI00360FC6E5